VSKTHWIRGRAHQIPKRWLNVVLALSTATCIGDAPTTPVAVNVIISTASSPSTGGTTSGGGSVASGTSVTVTAAPSSGYAFTNWTEGGAVISTNPQYTLMATSNRTLTANFTNAISISVQSPTLSLTDTLSFRAFVTSQFTITGVRATISGRQTSLAFSGSQNQWIGALSLAGLPYGPLALVLTATDVNGTSGSAATLMVNHDLRPQVTVTAPDSFDVAHPSIHYAATCVDDGPGGCASLVLLVDNVQLTSGTSSLNGTVSLGSYDGRIVTLTVRGTDSAGQMTSVSTDVYVESSTSIDSVGAVPGFVRDYRAGRAVYERRRDGGPAAAVRTLASGSEQSIAVPSGYQIGRAFVTPAGAILTAYVLYSTQSYLYELRNGTTTVSSRSLNSTTNLTADGQYALFGFQDSGFAFAPNGPLYRRDLVSGTDVAVALEAANSDNAVASNGDVAYWRGPAPYDVFRYRNGTTTQLTHGDGTTWNLYPLTDGVNVVFARLTVAGNQTYQLVLNDGSSEQLLTAPAPAPAGQPSPQWDYAVNGGWTAFTKRDANNVPQVWLRSPTGTLRQVTTFGTSCQIGALGSDGTVVLTAGSRRYIASATGTPRDVGSSLGTVVWRDGAFVLMLGRTVWTIRS
jgi:hypothetical protein